MSPASTAPADAAGRVGASDDEYGRFSGTVPQADLERCFFLDDADLARVDRRRGDHNRIGFALQLGTVRYLGTFLADPIDAPTPVIDYVADQVGAADPSCVKHYMSRRTTRFEHAAEIAAAHGYADFASAARDLPPRPDDRAP
ncbi:MAG: DUF4158 domain-containing protein, partial [bacterium]|nr:DUF4158 domain-containing protein [bacterium]